jgi:hypothetical protein
MQKRVSPNIGIIDPLQQRCEFHRLHAEQYELVPLEHNRLFRSAALEGFWLDVEWLLAKSLPNEYEILQEILRGP